MRFAMRSTRSRQALHPSKLHLQKIVLDFQPILIYNLLYRSKFMTLRRDLVKYVRDKAKSQYKKATECYICGVTEELDFHHFYGLTELLEWWLKEKQVIINSEKDILALREQFIEENYEQVYEHAVTLCHMHHLKLHSIYGKRPKLVTAEKQQNWVEIQRRKYGMV